eukprot:EG_transcript_18345
MSEGVPSDEAPGGTADHCASPPPDAPPLEAPEAEGHSEDSSVGAPSPEAKAVGRPSAGSERDLAGAPRPAKGKGRRKRATPAAPINTARYKTRMCINWDRDGKCPYGPRCQFAHGMRELTRHLNAQQYGGEPHDAGHFCPAPTLPEMPLAAFAPPLPPPPPPQMLCVPLSSLYSAGVPLSLVNTTPYPCPLPAIGFAPGCLQPLPVCGI